MRRLRALWRRCSARCEDDAGDERGGGERGCGAAGAPVDDESGGGAFGVFPVLGNDGAGQQRRAAQRCGGERGRSDDLGEQRCIKVVATA